MRIFIKHFKIILTNKCFKIMLWKNKEDCKINRTLDKLNYLKIFYNPYYYKVINLYFY